MRIQNISQNNRPKNDIGFKMNMGTTLEGLVGADGRICEEAISIAKNRFTRIARQQHDISHNITLSNVQDNKLHLLSADPATFEALFVCVCRGGLKAADWFINGVINHPSTKPIHVSSQGILEKVPAYRKKETEARHKFADALERILDIFTYGG